VYVPQHIGATTAFLLILHLSVILQHWGEAFCPLFDGSFAYRLVACVNAFQEVRLALCPAAAGQHLKITGAETALACADAKLHAWCVELHCCDHSRIWACN
jgi:hypothetical protein